MKGAKKKVTKNFKKIKEKTSTQKFLTKYFNI